MTILASVLGTLVLAGSALAAADPSQQIPAEDDWWLPEWVQPRADVVDFYDSPPAGFPVRDITLVTQPWREINPSEGVYDWSVIERALADANRTGARIALRIENSHVEHCPDWLVQKYPDLARKRLPSENYWDNFDNVLSGDFYPIWHAGFSREFRRFIASFKAKGFGGDPALVFAYIPGAWAWGEYGISYVDEMIAAGLTPQDYMRWFEETIDAYVDAFGAANAHKLMYTGHDYIPLCDGNVTWRRAIMRHDSAYAFAKGCGTRFGFLEKYNFMMTDMPNYGVRTVEHGGGRYMVVDDDAPLLRERRPIGTENEEAGNLGIPVKHYHQAKMTVLKTLQLRCTTVFFNRNIWNLGPDVHRYMVLSLGKQVHESADAWCALREGRDVYQEWSRYDQGVRGEWWVRNFERWLMQREVDGDGRTVRLYTYANPTLFNEHSYEARRTDRANGSDHIYFDVHDRFLHGGSTRVLVKVTWLDEGSGAWWIEYDGASARNQRSASIARTGDGRWKTTTLSLDDARFAGGLTAGMDFRIVNGYASDLTVRFVRVIRRDPPGNRSPTVGGGATATPARLVLP